MTSESILELFALEDCFEINKSDPMEITWPDAVRWAKNFRRQYESSQKFGDKKIKGYYLSRGNLMDLLYQDGLALQGVKIYLGLDEDGVFRVILVGVKGAKSIDYKVPKDESELQTIKEEDLPTLGEVRPCPEWCGSPNILNEG